MLKKFLIIAGVCAALIGCGDAKEVRGNDGPSKIYNGGNTSSSGEDRPEYYIELVGMPKEGIVFGYEQPFVFDVEVRDENALLSPNVEVKFSFPKDIISLEVKGATINTDKNGRLRVTARAIVAPFTPVSGTVTVFVGDAQESFHFTTYKFEAFYNNNINKTMRFAYPKGTKLEVYCDAPNLTMYAVDNVVYITAARSGSGYQEETFFKLKVNDNAPVYYAFNYYCGAGTAQWPYLIESKLDLRLINSLWNTSNAIFKQINNISLEGEVWTPVGTDIGPFAGTYFGGGFKITELSINSKESDMGLFGIIDGAKIYDLHVYGDLKTTGVSGALFAAVARSAVIDNCSAEGTVVTSGSAAGFINSVSYTKITNSYAKVDINADYAGGLVYLMDNSSIQRSFTYGDIWAKKGSSGGISGRAVSSTVADSYSLVNIRGKNRSGGILGESIFSIVSRSYAAGDVNGEIWSGGITGYAEGPVVGVEYSAALNLNVRSPVPDNYIISAGRIIGYTKADSSTDSSSTRGAYAFSKMALNGRTIAVGQADEIFRATGALEDLYGGLNGADIIEDLDELFHNRLGWSANVWDFNTGDREYKLPVLKEMRNWQDDLTTPAHLLSGQDGI